jgi:VWFA-related protein
VTIDGRQRKVLSVDLIRHREQRAGTTAPIVSGPGATNQWPPTGPVARTFVIAVDVSSFTMADSRSAVQAARGFIDRLDPNDLVGLYACPLGPKIEPTFDRPRVRREMDTIMGGAQSLTSRYHLSPAEVMDVNYEAARLPMSNSGRATAQSALAGNEGEAIKRVQLRECGSETDTRCVEHIIQEAQTMAFFYEGEMMRTVGGLGALLQGLGPYPGRKTVVLISGGMPVADLPGGRPTFGESAKVLGEEAARANVNVYAMHLDTLFLRSNAAETRQHDRRPVNRERESVMMGRFLDEFAGTSGGTMMRILVGSGEGAYETILRETSTYYMVGVGPNASDRDGRTHRLRVAVGAKGATVRSRTFVHIPKKQQS